MEGNTYRVIVAGATGFIGRALRLWLSAAGIHVCGVARRPNGECGIHCLDLEDRQAVANLLRDVKPDVIFHTAGAIGQADEALLHRAHVTTTEVLLRAVHSVCPEARVVIVGSAAEYGTHCCTQGSVPEGATPSPDSPYGRSKLQQSELAQQMASQLGLRVIRLRLFNTIGQGQSPALVAGAMVSRVFEALTHGREEFEAFDPESERDYLDVSDVARLAWVAARTPAPADRPPIHIASGEGTTVRELAETLLRVARLEDRLRPRWVARSPRTASVGLPTTLRQLLAEDPIRRVPISTSLSRMWEWQLRHPVRR